MDIETETPDESSGQSQLTASEELDSQRTLVGREASTNPPIPSVARASAFLNGHLIEDRYEIQQQLGRGGFGAVYSAFDRSLKRTVAIKQSSGLHSFVSGQVRNEAQAVASLNHPNIVQIHDLIQVSDTELLIVMERLEGMPLSERLRQSRLTTAEAVKIGVEVCNALIHAHEKQLVHSDLKPANLFLSSSGLVKLLDFGLAVAYFPNKSTDRIGGTPGYMSPEQIRGESHLIDGRTDVWAFGIVMFEMLTGARPFSAENVAAMKQLTLIKLAPPLRQLNPDIDSELQRIVSKCLQPLIKSRYDSVSELRDDLVHWLESQGESIAMGTLAPTKQDTVPNSFRLGKIGLQPFTEQDASTYLALIPGTRDRNGIPDSIRFWKRWVESNDPDTSYPVGVMYGPSGSGKTSYIRAGLFKQLSPDICRVYIECRSGDLGGRLTKIIESRLQRESGGSSLRDLLLRFRSGDSGSHGYHKLLIVLDQFESWVQSATIDERLDFAEALRQCDGIQIRALVVTRDDYWAGVKELMHWLELPLQEGRNAASVDLLDRDHAERILEAMGRESGVLPAEQEPLTREQADFIKQAVNELTIDGSVICVHLVIFAQMVQLQKWTPRGLRDSDGVTGACSLFFQELFDPASRRSPEYQRIAPAVMVVLAKLVPPMGHTVAEQNVDVQELGQALQDSGHIHLMEDCLRVLSQDLRVITAVGTDQSDEESGRNDQYRLAHDFLVEPVNTFLSRMQSRSWRGRTKSRLSELSSTWSRRRTPVHLPGFFEYVTLAIGSVFQRRNAEESQFLRAATHHHAGRISIAVITSLAFLLMSMVAWHQWTVAGEAKRREMTANVDLLLNGPTSELPQRIETLRKFGSEANAELAAWSDSVDPNLQLRSEIYLQTVQPESMAEIAPLLANTPTEFFDLVLNIAQRANDATSVLKQTYANENDSIGANRAAILLAYLGDDSAIGERLQGSEDADIEHGFILDTTQWRGKPNLWADLVNDSADPLIRYHAGIVLGGYPESELNAAGITFDFPAMINSPDSTIHSLGRYLAHHFGEDALGIPLNPPAGADWRVGPDNIPMVRLDKARFDYESPIAHFLKRNQDFMVEVDHPAWMATIPVSKRLYAEFLASNPTPEPEEKSMEVDLERFHLPEYLAGDEQPMFGTSLAQAYVFCNWLSRREGLQECYSEKEVDVVEINHTFKGGTEGKRVLHPIPWDCDMNANGYRTPTISEYQLAVRTKYEHGLAWKHALAISASSGFVASRHAQPLLQLHPSKLGVFAFDPSCGAWTSGSDRITGQHVSQQGTTDGLLQYPAGPGTCIYLVQAAGLD
ncbi:MAG: protein kinase [Rubripirellula sp.]